MTHQSTKRSHDQDLINKGERMDRTNQSDEGPNRGYLRGSRPSGPATPKELRQLQKQLPKYRVLALVGQGQFGKVFCAIERKTGQLVALKELTHLRLPTHKFLRELLSLLTLQHPHIVTCRALEQTPAARYLVMDYCEGATLRELLEANASLSLGEGMQLMLGILAGLESAHDAGIIHCDIKPENILLSVRNGSWFARLSDFGIARRFGELQGSRRGENDEMEAVGATAYAAPEGFYGLYSRGADIYSMGILLFELLLGYRPFTGKPGDLMWAHLNQRLQVPEQVPLPLRLIVEKALEKLPARRYSSAAQMAQGIQEAMNEPAVRLWGDRPLPLNESPLQSKPECPSSQHSRIPLAVPTTALVSQDGYLYAAHANQVRLWHQLALPPKVVDFPDRVTEVLPGTGGCWVSTGRRLYWLAIAQGQPQQQLTCDGEFRMAIDPDCRWLAIAVPGQLNFYSLASLPPTGFKAPDHHCPIPDDELPRILFLDSKHLLAIRYDSTPNQGRTLFQVYTRRGTRVGSESFQGILDPVILTEQPYTLVGITRHPRPALWQIQLWPLRVRRLPLETLPVCLSSVPGGGATADEKGQILWFNNDLEPVAAVQGPGSPIALAAAFNSGTQMPPNPLNLAIATRTDFGGAIHFFQIEGRKPDE
ncbi:serine/threonine-protein kinase [Laspinema olomoucense]|uniref:serine/threonine-protein kinase n=1 Tax=Laspinema olomoucense TaxID=3231600 RepID=UPI0021BAAFA6|nr:serine/threonine-protein kinase [Laspinema sp. D3a]MCT7990350.1 serine/threonine protein kinase [Laspinema sp. D3a]